MEQTATPSTLRSTKNKQQRSPSDAKEPILRIYESASMMHGKRHPSHHWMNHAVRRQNEFLRQVFIDSLGFKDFDEWITTVGKPDVTDGWHYNFAPRRMNGQILLNMACAQEL